MKKIVSFILGIVGLLGVDWFTKYLAQVHLGERRVPIIGEFLQLRYVVNTGLSFSRFAGNKVVTMLVPVFGMTVAIVMYYFLKKNFQKRNEIRMIKGLNFIAVFFLAGAIGNYADRMINGGVRDFFSVKGFAVFNVADIYVTVCQVLIIIMGCYQGWKESKEKKVNKV